jgi:hypothetical protein
LCAGSKVEKVGNSINKIFGVTDVGQKWQYGQVIKQFFDELNLVESREIDQ